MWEMDDPEIVILDEYAQSEAPLFGIEIPQRLFWEAFVMRRDINREPGSKHDIGRPSRPAFQDMNFASLRSHPKDGKPRAVVYQYESEDPMDARNLVVAYEDNDRILPVVSDFDCFLVGTRSVSYKELLPDDQIQLVHWCLTNIESILEAPLMPNSWTERWLEVLKETPMKTKMPPYGFGDPTSYSVIKVAIERLNKDGCVRHGAECFNYYFPQELDDHFLIIGEGMNENGPPNWKYVSVAELQKILLKKVKEGYSFPLNPEWVLCDPGWKEIFDEQFKSESQHVKDSLDSWYPPSSGIRETIQRIAGAHPNGFQRLLYSEENQEDGKVRKLLIDESDDNDGTAAMDLAEQALKQYETFKRAKRKLKVALIWMKFALDRQREREKEEAGGSSVESERTNLSRTLSPILRHNIRASMRDQPALRFRTSGNDQSTSTALPKLLDRVQTHKSFTASDAPRMHTFSLLKPKLSLQPTSFVRPSMETAENGSGSSSSSLLLEEDPPPPLNGRTRGPPGRNRRAGTAMLNSSGISLEELRLAASAGTIEYDGADQS
jgi:hypothetical protein